MKRISIVLIFLAFAMFFTTQAQVAKDAVVQVKTGISAIGTGFVWPDKYHVVTALHVVAGREDLKVRSYTPGHMGHYNVVEVEKVLMEADLCILRLDRPLDVTIPEISNSVPSVSQHYTMYRTSIGGGSIYGETKELESEIHKLRVLIGPDNQTIYGALLKQGYPKVDAYIARIRSVVRSGDSGSPICDSQGKIIGIVDGGLFKGLRGLNWAIVASKYLDNLKVSKEKYADVKKNDPKIYLVTDNVEDNKPLKFPKGSSYLELQFTTTLADINNTMGYDREELQEIENDYKKILETTGKYISNAKIDVYQDLYSGATIAIPHGLTLQFSDAESNYIWVEALSPSSNVKMTFTIVGDLHDPSGEFSQSIVDYILEYMEGSDWDQSVDSLILSEEEYYSYSYNCMNEFEDEVDIELIYNYNDFMALSAFIYADDYATDEVFKEDEYFFALIRECISLSDFPVY